MALALATLSKDKLEVRMKMLALFFSHHCNFLPETFLQLRRSPLEKFPSLLSLRGPRTILAFFLSFLSPPPSNCAIFCTHTGRKVVFTFAPCRSSQKSLGPQNKYAICYRKLPSESAQMPKKGREFFCWHSQCANLKKKSFSWSPTCGSTHRACRRRSCRRRRTPRRPRRPTCSWAPTSSCSPSSDVSGHWQTMY